jgi:malonyl-CoA/methylmalonyl-CoA synthetase
MAPAAPSLESNGDSVGNESLYGAMYRRFALGGDSCALDMPGANPVSFRELEFAVAQCANALEALGIVPDDRVAVQAEKSSFALILYLACLRSGAIFIPLNTAYKIRESMQIIEDALPKFVISTPVGEGALREAIGQSTAFGGPAAAPVVVSIDASDGGDLWRTVSRQTSVHAAAKREAEDAAVILYTSGTTGRPKGAILSQRALRINAETLVDLWKITSSDKLIHCLPLFHAHGLFVAANVALVSGCSMLWLPRFGADQIVDCFGQATIFMGVPTLYTRLLEVARLTPGACRRIRLFLSGSAPLSVQTHKQFRARTGHEIVERYGMTEAGINASNPIDGARKPGTVGFPVPGVQIRIFQNGTIQGPDQVGEVQIKGPNLFSGYWNRPAETAKAMDIDGWFSTGDVGRFDDAGYLTLLSRKKDVIITGGYNVYPAEVEVAFEAIAEVQEVAVFGVPHPDFGEGVVATVVLKAGQEKLFNERDIISKLKTLIASYKIPKRILPIESLPRNAMGKVTKPDLVERFGKTFVASDQQPRVALL